MMRRLAAVSLAVMVSACSGPDGTRRQASSQASLEAALSRPAAWAQASGGASAIAMLPSGAGEVAQVRERDYLNGFGQEITLKGGSAAEANRVEITVAGQAGGRGDALAPMAKPSEAGIKAEIAARFPGLAMQVVTRPMKNAYGPYGLAVGRQPGGARCVYAWQWIDAVREAAPASVRVRLCRSNATLDQLAGYIDQMTVDLGRRSAVPETLERALGEAVPQGPPGPGKEARTISRRPTTAPTRNAAGRSPRPADTAASVVWRADGRQYLGPVPASRTASAVEWARIGRPPSDPRRPNRAGDASASADARTTAVPSPNVSAGSAAAPKRGKSLDASLPSRAYLGPSAQAGRASTAAFSYEAAIPSPARTEQR